MLRKNIQVEAGLVNGALGTLRDKIYHNDGAPPDMPYLLLIEFDNYQGPYIRDNLYPLEAVNLNWKMQSVECSRKQFPICLAYSMTIHKSQGLTLEKVTIDIGDREMSPGLTYVALSRVKRLDDIVFRFGVNLGRLNRIAEMRLVQDRERFLANF